MAQRAQWAQAEEEASSEGEAAEGPQAQRGGGQEGVLAQAGKASIMSIRVSRVTFSWPHQAFKVIPPGFVFSRRHVCTK